MVSDGAGILGKCVKLAFTSSPLSPTHLSASFLPPLFTPAVLSPRLSLRPRSCLIICPHRREVRTPGQSQRLTGVAGPSLTALFSAALYGPVTFEHQFSVWLVLIKSDCWVFWALIHAASLILLILNTLHIHYFVQNGWIINTIV